MFQYHIIDSGMLESDLLAISEVGGVGGGKELLTFWSDALFALQITFFNKNFKLE